MPPAARSALLIPVEEQVREFDAKLLLACSAAEQGFRAVIGSRHDLHLRAASLPRGLYFAKSFRRQSLRMFTILRDLGHDIVACDEEALVAYPDDLYFERRLDRETLAAISVLFAWGPASAALFQRCPGYGDAPIHATGSPRVDMMRAELRPFFDTEVRALERRFGDFVLVNTNFGTVNHFVPQLGWLASHMRSQGHAAARDAGNGSSDDYVSGLARHRKELFARFQQLIPRLARAFPERTIVVRPHPVEDHGVWREVAARSANVEVIHEGSVLPWLLAARCLVHNGCTTSIEAFVLGRASVAYRPVTSQRYDYGLPNQLGYSASGDDELCDRVRDVVDRGLGAPDDADQRKLIETHLSGLDGPLASDRIAGTLADHARGRAGRAPAPLPFARGWLHAQLRAAWKRARARRPGNQSSAAYLRHRFPTLSGDAVQARIDRFGAILGRFQGVEARPLSEHIFEVTR